MGTVAAVLLGLGTGVVGLFPGLHFSMVILFVGPWFMTLFSPSDALLGLASAVISSRCMHALAVVYHPVSGDNMASADPAQRLAAQGKGDVATAILSESLWVSTRIVVFLFAAITIYGLAADKNMIKEIMQALSFVSLPAILIWIGFTIYNAVNPVATILVMLASGGLGVVALNSPAVQGSQHAMTPLLTGLFALPVLLMTVMEKVPKNKRVHHRIKNESDEVPEDLKWFGMLVGLTSVVLPGLGTSSLTSIGQDMADTDAKYLTMAGFAESTGEMLALILGILGIASRSSDAAVIQKIMAAPEGIGLSAVFGVVLAGTMLVSCWMGIALMQKLSFPYKVMINLIPSKLQAGIVGTGMVWVVWAHTQTWGMGILLAGTLIHLGARQMKTGNQAFFACMIFPMLLSMLHIRAF